MNRPLRHIPTSIWVLGFVSMLMDISSEMIHSFLPLFIVTTLGRALLQSVLSRAWRSQWLLSSRCFQAL